MSSMVPYTISNRVSENLTLTSVTRPSLQLPIKPEIFVAYLGNKFIWNVDVHG